MRKTEKNIELFEKHGVFTRSEINSRIEIILENYTKTVHIEALTLIDMMTREVIPTISAYTDKLCQTLINKNRIGGVDGLVEKELIARLGAAEREIFTLTNELKNVVATSERTTDIFEKSVLYHDSVLRIMGDIRKYADSAECVVPAEIWPYPSYGELLFNI